MRPLPVETASRRGRYRCRSTGVRCPPLRGLSDITDIAALRFRRAVFGHDQEALTTRLRPIMDEIVSRVTQDAKV